jgi:hypothetical protein
VGVDAYIISGFPSWGRMFFQAQGGALGCPVNEKLEETLVKLKLLAEERLDAFLVKLKLLAEEKLDESLVRLNLLAEERLDASLVRLKLLFEERMVGSLVRIDLKHAKEKNSPQFGSPKFPLELISRG